VEEVALAAAEREARVVVGVVEVGAVAVVVEVVSCIVIESSK